MVTLGDFQRQYFGKLSQKIEAVFVGYEEYDTEADWCHIRVYLMFSLVAPIGFHKIKT